MLGIRNTNPAVLGQRPKVMASASGEQKGATPAILLPTCSPQHGNRKRPTSREMHQGRLGRLVQLSGPNLGRGHPADEASWSFSALALRGSPVPGPGGPSLSNGCSTTDLAGTATEGSLAPSNVTVAALCPNRPVQRKVMNCHDRFSAPLWAAEEQEAARQPHPVVQCADALVVEHPPVAASHLAKRPLAGKPLGQVL